MDSKSIIALIKREVVPALGCTEPAAVALCVAKACEQLGARPDRIDVQLSANVLKNAMGVGVPGTGMVGLPIAIALGAIVGRSEYQLEVIKDVTPAKVSEAKEYLKALDLRIRRKKDCCDNLYIEVEVGKDERSSKAIIEGDHTNFVECGKQPKPTFAESGMERRMENASLTLKEVYDFAMETDVEELRFILEARDMNLKAARESIKGNYGHCLGKTIDRPLAHGIFGNSIFSHIISKTASACDARMGGALIAVMSNSGSGNQGICATNPVAVYAEENENTEEETIRALILSHLTVIYIKQSLGKLSALCGCVVASIGSSCGITYLMGGDYQRICYAVQNMIANLTGIICDGAKPSCSLKITSGVSTALLSALLSMEGRHVTSAEGIIDENVDNSIRNLTSIGADAMCVTDEKILEIMVNKH